MELLDVIIRRALSDDADAIRVITRRCYYKWVEVLGREPLPMQVDYAEAVRLHRIDLMISDHEPIGLIETVLRGGDTLIENVAVLPEHQGRGYGRRLLKHVEQVAEAEGSRHLRLYTNKLFAENIRLYEHLGFVVDREESFRGGLVVHMIKELGGA